MIFIDRPAVYPDVCVIGVPTFLFALLKRVVAGPAKRLEFAFPEFGLIAAISFDVVGNRSRGQNAEPMAFTA